jgi:ABC-2 type transport system ATP-binding protein
MEPIISVKGLMKRYGDTLAVEDISFDVQPNEIFTIVGPNGAGKTTTVESLIGLRIPDQGTVTVLGMSPQKQRAAVAQRIGVQLQHARLPDRLKVWEVFDLFRAFYRRTIPWEPLLEQWGLAEKRNSAVDKLSGGQQQRLFIALALLNDPEIVFLDELTTGLDPQARRATWELVREVRDRGKTVILVTHFMDEAQTLADRVAIIDGGKLLALDTPDCLIKGLEAESKVIFSPSGVFNPEALRSLRGVSGYEWDGRQLVVRGQGALLQKVAAALDAQNITATDLRLESATLEDVFLARTGKQIRD